MSQTIGYARVSAADQLATVHPIRLGQTTAGDALAALDRHLARCKLAEKSAKAYRRWAVEFVSWPGLVDHRDAFQDQTGAEAAVHAWRRHLLGERKLSPAATNQALVAVKLMYQVCRITARAQRAREPKAGAPKALTRAQEGAVRRAADRRGPRDAAIVAVLLGAGARVAECARLQLDDVAVTARTGEVRLFGKGDQVRTVPVVAPVPDRLSTWLREHPGDTALWPGQRGPMTVEGITKVVLAAGAAAGMSGLRPHALRHTYATRLREGGMDVAQIQALMGHTSIETTARYFRAGAVELAAAVEKALDY